MSAALIGMVFGALGSGPLADRFGRKVVLVGAVLLFGAFSLASAYSTNVDQLLVLRFLTGLGLGAGMPNATTLSEYTPNARSPAGDQHVLRLQPGHGGRRIYFRQADPGVRLAQPCC
jgi:MFS family permease